MKLAPLALSLVLLASSLQSCRSSDSPAENKPSPGDKDSMTLAPVTKPGARSRKWDADDAMLKHVKELHAQADDAKAAGDRDRARKLTIDALAALMSEKEMYDSPARCHEMFELSELADRLGEMDLADSAYKRVCRAQNHNFYRAWDSQDGAAEPTGLVEATSQSPGASSGSEPAMGARPLAPPEGAMPSNVAANAPDTRTEDEKQLDQRLADQERLVEDMARASTHPEDDLDLLEARRFLARLLEAKGNMDAARAIYLEILDEYTRFLAKGDRRLQGARMDLGSLLLKQGDFAGAAKLFGAAVEGYADAPHENPPGFVAALEGEARALEGLHQSDRVAPLLVKALEIRAGEVPNDEAATQATQSELGAVLVEQQQHVDELHSKGDIEPASAMQQQILDGYRMLSSSQPGRVLAEESMASLLQQQCRFTDALALRRSIVDERRQHTAPGDADLGEANRELAALLRVMGRTDEARTIEKQIADAQPHD